MDAPQNIVAAREQVRAKQNALGEAREQHRQLIQQLQEADNWLNGHQWTDEALRAQGLFGEAQDKKAEVRSLRGKIAEISERINALPGEPQAWLAQH